MKPGDYYDAIAETYGELTAPPGTMGHIATVFQGCDASRWVQTGRLGGLDCPARPLAFAARAQLARREHKALVPKGVITSFSFTCACIASHTGCTAKDLIQLNPGVNYNELKIGQVRGGDTCGE